MIARLVGTLVAREAHRAVIDVRDVGYAVHAPLHDVETWARAGGAVTVHVSTDVREDAITLYGFSTDVDRKAFEQLRTVNGVGPKVALAALDAMGLDALVSAVAAGDVTALTRVPGVGKKLASRMVLELKGKLTGSFAPTAGGGSGGAAAAVPAGDDPLDLALARLGYTKTEIAKAHTGLAAHGVAADAPVSDRLREALRLLSGS